MKMFKNNKRGVKASNKPAPRRRAIKADEYYPESYADLGYDGLDGAVNALNRAIENAEALLQDLKGLAEQYDEWGGSTPTIEMFASPDDAMQFADDMGQLADDLYRLDYEWDWSAP